MDKSGDEIRRAIRAAAGVSMFAGIHRRQLKVRGAGVKVNSPVLTDSDLTRSQSNLFSEAASSVGPAGPLLAASRARFSVFAAGRER